MKLVLVFIRLRLNSYRISATSFTAPSARFIHRLRLVTVVTQELKIAVIVAAALLKRHFMIDFIAPRQPNASTSTTDELLIDRDTFARLDPAATTDARRCAGFGLQCRNARFLQRANSSLERRQSCHLIVTRIARLIFASSFAGSASLPVITQHHASTKKYGLSHHANEIRISLFMKVTMAHK
uniref:hypothetical protein n=1 Tax=Burkholderia cepacia TaxID=292 RepID=UPI003F7A8BFF